MKLGNWMVLFSLVQSSMISCKILGISPLDWSQTFLPCMVLFGMLMTFAIGLFMLFIMLYMVYIFSETL